MPIKINLSESDTNLFAASKWWGDPDMPCDMKYPVLQVEEDGESFDYPLTFLCQIACEELAAFDSGNLFPHEGMLYFFAAVDEYVGFDAPFHNGEGRWPKGHVAVKYTRSVNMETFETVSLLGEDEGSVTADALKVRLSDAGSSEDAREGICMLSVFSAGDTAEGGSEDADVPVSLLHLPLAGKYGFDILISRKDLSAGSWKRAFGFLRSL